MATPVTKIVSITKIAGEEVQSAKIIPQIIY